MRNGYRLAKERYTRPVGVGNKGVTAASKPIICNETKVEYKSLSEASKVLQIHISRISDQLRGRTETANGYTFKYK